MVIETGELLDVTAFRLFPLQAESLTSADPNILFKSLAILLLAYLGARAISRALTSAADRLVTERFRVTLLIPVAKFLIYGSAVYIVTSMLFELSTTHLVAFSGFLGAAIGLGLRDLVADIVGGIVLVAERPYRIGDKVAIGEYYGEVVDIGIRSTKLFTADDTVITVPNYLFFDKSIANSNAGRAEMMVTVEFFIDTDSNVETASRIVKDAIATSQYVYVTNDLPIELVVEDELNYRLIRGKGYVNDLRNELKMKSDVTERVLEAFDEEGIESPIAPIGWGREEL